MANERPFPGPALKKADVAVDVTLSAFGDEQWAEKTAARLGLQYTLNPRGRPRNHEEES
jgi:hypothetical protein